MRDMRWKNFELGVVLFAMASLMMGACAPGTPPQTAGGESELDSTSEAEATPEPVDVFVDAEVVEGDGMDIRAAAGAHENTLVPVGPKDPIKGAFEAPVTIVIVSDLECPSCGRGQSTLRELEERYGLTTLRFVWKNNPLPFHKKAMGAHEAAMAVFEEAGNDAFWAFHDLAFQHRTSLNRKNFAAWAGQAGASWPAVKRRLDDGVVQGKIAADMKWARSVGAFGAPTFFINGHRMSGAQPVEKFREIIDAEVNEAKSLLAEGKGALEIYPIRVADHDTDLTERNVGAPREKRKFVEDTTPRRIEVYQDDPWVGAKEPLVTVVVFAEFQCPFCKRVEPTLKQILEEYPDQVRLVWKDNPLAFHPLAKPAAVAARVAYKQGGNQLFWRMHDLLFEGQPKLKDEDIKGYLKKVGVGSWAFDAAMKRGTFDAKLEQSMEMAVEFEARGTPHFFVNGVRVAGAQSIEKFRKVIDSQIKVAEQKLAEGVARKDIYEELLKDARGPALPEMVEVPTPTHRLPTRGSARSKITIYQFSDFQCPFCSRANATIEEVLKKHGSEVKIEWLNLPLPFHKQAALAAEAAHEIFVQKGDKAFWRYHDLLFETQREGLEREQLERLATEVGADMKKFNRALNEGTHKSLVEEEVQLAKTLGVKGTPGFIINGYFISGAQPYPKFKRTIDLAKKDLQKK